MLCPDVQTQAARKAHRCTFCGEAILPGETYHRWASVDGDWYCNKAHPECLPAIQAIPDVEYTPYEQERPK